MNLLHEVVALLVGAFLGGFVMALFCAAKDRQYLHLAGWIVKSPAGRFHIYMASNENDARVIKEVKNLTGFEVRAVYY